jgi:quercetin 2,3-dioxygenase
MKKLLTIHRSTESHWVGDGFPVRNIFSPRSLGDRMSPFILLDYAGPAEFPPSERPRGVSQHPHRGFETVTIAYQGEVEHGDSAGNHGTIGPGDVQWMTAASGVLHEEMHSREFSKRGGIFEMVQLWVNLPARFKMTPPRYQTLLKRDIPSISLGGGCGQLRIIAGEYEGTQGPARTFTPINLWDLRMREACHLKLSVPNDHTTALFVLNGKLTLNGAETIGEAELALFDRAGQELMLDAEAESIVLVLSGEPIHEPVAAQGPFVMNTQDEIRQAMEDYQNGRLGRMTQ